MRRVEQVVVVGADAPAWLTAAAIYRSFGGAGVRVRVIELQTRLQPVDVYSALPTLAGLHHRLGVDEELLFELCKTLPVVGQRFSNWSGAGSPFIHGYDRVPELGGAALDFIHFWIKGRKRGLRTDFESFSFGAMAAKAGRVPTLAENPELDAAYGYHIDASAYSALLRHLVLRSGIESKASTISTVETDGERISAVILGDGERVEADLFVDASGGEGILISRMPGAEFESWREWFPCDRLLIAAGKMLRPYPAFSEISAFRQGWVGLFPLQDRTAVIAAYDSREISDNSLLERLPILANLPIAGDAVGSDVTSGVRKRMWVGNCVAVGDSAFSLEPLDAVQLHVTHDCISQLMTLFPVEAGVFPEAELYDEIVRRVAANLRDFQLAHYKLNRRFDEPLWDRCRDAAVPQTLQRKLDVFAARGRIPLYDDETFQEHDWESLFIGHGMMPQSYDPRVDAMPEQDHIASLQKRLNDIIELVHRMPTVDEFVSRSSVEAPTKAAHG